MREMLLEDRRLAALRLLVEAGGSANESVLEMGLRALGHRAELDRAAVRQLLRDLEERECVGLELFDDRVMVATISRRGRLAAVGDVRVDGVKDPHGL